MHPEFYAFLLVLILSGVYVTRLWHRRKRNTALVERLDRWLPRVQSDATEPVTLLKGTTPSSLDVINVFISTSMADRLATLLRRANFRLSAAEFCTVVAALAFAPPAVALCLDSDWLMPLLGGVIAGISLVTLLTMMAEKRRVKFCEQLPDAVDLMIAVLRSGHSIPQAVRAISEEVSAPCGSEFEHILYRMNLGQPLADAINPSAELYESNELDLIRRAIAIHTEMGGNLSELLDKTNQTLRDRLKLVRQVKVVTAQSRLTATIVAILPVALAFVLNYMHPGYLAPLLDRPDGRTMLLAAVGLEVLGILIMKRMATMKV